MFYAFVHDLEHQLFIVMGQTHFLLSYQPQSICAIYYYLNNNN